MLIFTSLNVAVGVMAGQSPVSSFIITAGLGHCGTGQFPWKYPQHQVLHVTKLSRCFLFVFSWVLLDLLFYFTHFFFYPPDIWITTEFHRKQSLPRCFHTENIFGWIVIATDKMVKCLYLEVSRRNCFLFGKEGKCARIHSWSITTSETKNLALGMFFLRNRWPDPVSSTSAGSWSPSSLETRARMCPLHQHRQTVICAFGPFPSDTFHSYKLSPSH